MTAPRGRWITIVGPDGSGKSAIAGLLATRLGASHFYWRPAVLPMPRQLLGRGAGEGVNATPHERRRDRPPTAVFRSFYYAMDFLLGYFTVYRPALRRGVDVIVERGVLDMLVDSRRYGLGRSRVLGLVARIVPSTDLLIVLVAGAATVRARKPELDEEEIRRQYRAWEELSIGFRQRTFIDSSSEPSHTLEKALAQLGCGLPPVGADRDE